MRFIISKGNKEKFEELKVFESGDIKATYNFIQANIQHDNFVSFEAFEREMNLFMGLDPVWGISRNNEGNEFLYMEVIR